MVVPLEDEIFLGWGLRFEDWFEGDGNFHCWKGDGMVWDDMWWSNFPTNIASACKLLFQYKPLERLCDSNMNSKHLLAELCEPIVDDWSADQNCSTDGEQG
jgi:hypothetical protein